MVPGILHRGLQDLAKLLTIAVDQTARIEAGQTPALTLRIETIGRRAHFDRRQDEILIVPRIKSIWPNADRKIKIEPDWQPETTCSIAARLKLLVSNPLYEFKIAELIGL